VLLPEGFEARATVTGSKRNMLRLTRPAYTSPMNGKNGTRSV